MLTKMECELLLDALDSWEKDVGDGMMGGLMTAMMSDRMGDEGKRKMEAELQVQEQKRMQEKRTRRARVIMLKAKILQMKDCIVAESITES